MPRIKRKTFIYNLDALDYKASLKPNKKNHKVKFLIIRSRKPFESAEEKYFSSDIIFTSCPKYNF
jgi:hypothetical protein